MAFLHTQQGDGERVEFFNRAFTAPVPLLPLLPWNRILRRILLTCLRPHVILCNVVR